MGLFLASFLFFFLASYIAPWFLPKPQQIRAHQDPSFSVSYTWLREKQSCEWKVWKERQMVREKRSIWIPLKRLCDPKKEWWWSWGVDSTINKVLALHSFNLGSLAPTYSFLQKWLLSTKPGESPDQSQVCPPHTPKREQQKKRERENNTKYNSQELMFPLNSLACFYIPTDGRQLASILHYTNRN